MNIFRKLQSILVVLLLSLSAAAQTNLSQYVDPFIGTGGHGHTFPGPTLPFGMIQPGPDTRLTGWDGCSGYHHSDTVIYGFSHTHLSGTGCSDYGDVMLMPTIGKIQWKNKQYSSPFKKENEKAGAGYYAVLLDKPGVLAELTTTLRTGLHRYTFPKSDQANFILDLTHRDKLVKGEINILNDHEISGYRISNQWASNQHVYFVIQFSKPFKNACIKNGLGISQAPAARNGRKLKACVQFETQEGEQILVKVGISAVSVEGARKNLDAEQDGFDFERVRMLAQTMWNKELGKIVVETEDLRDKRIFYTAMYHAMIAPNIFQDVDGMYRGRDGKNHHAIHGYYTVFSLWDTYRALHPLLTIIDKKRTSDFIKTFLLQYDQAGLLPIWELAGYETFCMIGNHSIPVMLDAHQKGITDFDAAKALEAMRKSTESGERELRKYRLPGSLLVRSSFYRHTTGFDHYLEKGYVKNGIFSSSVSRTLEYAYNDWCVAQMAKALGDTSLYRTYTERAANYKNVFDASTRFMRARKGKGFVRKFDPYHVSQRHYTEANAWQYAFYVPHDITGHISLLGGKEAMSRFLDETFSTKAEIKGGHLRDITGMMGQYAHGNEPSHHMAYLYNYTAEPWKTQKMTNRILREMYSDQPDGLIGNEDCGQMSAWFIFSSLGFYPVCPGSDHYAIGSPLFPKATIHLENGQSFSVETINNSKDNIYIQSATLNGQPFGRYYLKYDDLANGGILQFTMGPSPNPDWGVKEGDFPKIGLNGK